MKAPVSPNDTQRLLVLHELHVLDTPIEHRFERITRLARRALGVPTALISLVDEHRQWFKSAQGLDACQTPRDISFCGHAIRNDEVLNVPDALADPRFKDNPLVLGEPHIRFYAGYPLSAKDGQKLGTLCVMDQEPRELEAEDLETLRDLAGWAESELRTSALSRAQSKLISKLDDARRQSLIDPLTRLWNRKGGMEILERELAEARDDGSPLGVILADLDHFKRINDTHGHASGDAVLRQAAKRMVGAVRPNDAVCRYGGEEFLVVVVDAQPATVAIVAERIRSAICAGPIRTEDSAIALTVSLGAALTDARVKDARLLLRKADIALYKAKDRGRDCVELAHVA